MIVLLTKEETVLVTNKEGQTYSVDASVTPNSFVGNFVFGCEDHGICEVDFGN